MGDLKSNIRAQGGILVTDPFTIYYKNNLAYIFFITLTFFYHLITEFHLHILNTTIVLSVYGFFSRKLLEPGAYEKGVVSLTVKEMW